MLHVFIDTNVYLRFFSYSSDTFDELKKLVALCEAEKIELYLTDQVKREISRNRDGEIARALKQFEASFASPAVPRFGSDSDEAKALLKAAKELSKARSKLRERLDADIESGSLLADELIESLENVSTFLETDEDEIEAARDRRDLGDPPGKKDSLGDQLNWELLLTGINKKNDLHVISHDGDFFSKLDEDQPHLSLSNEWSIDKKANLHVYRSLSEFAKKHFPDIKLPSDVFKSDWITRLSKAGSFATTHKYIEKLDGIFEDLTLEDAVRLFQAMIDNEQVNWISSDSDVKDFYEKLYQKFEDQTSAELDVQLHSAADYLGMPF